MRLLRLRSKKGEQEASKLMGVYVSPSEWRYITLYTLATGESKSILLRDLITKWIRHECKQSEKELIEKIVRKMQNQWRAEKSIHHDASLVLYKEKLNNELHTRGLEEYQITSILDQITDTDGKEG